jgi:hypothetical protein
VPRPAGGPIFHVPEIGPRPPGKRSRKFRDGYAGKPDNIRTQIRRWEHDERSIPQWICRLAWMYGKHGLPKEYASIGSNP